MNKKWVARLLIPFLMLGISFNGWADKYDVTIDMFKKSPQVQRFFNNAYGYAVFPVVGKGGFAIGGSYGKGQVYRGGKPTGKASLSQLTIGFQLGGQAFSQIIFFEDESSYREFTNGSFEFGAQATAVAITAGAQAQAGTTGTSAGASVNTDDPGRQVAKYYKGMVTFVHVTGGLMYEASIGGQAFKFKPYGSQKAAFNEPKPVVNSQNAESSVSTYAVDPIEPVSEIK